MKKPTTKSDSYGQIPTLEVVRNEAQRRQVRVAVYARVSTAKQKTIEEQVRLCRDRAKDRNWRVSYVIQDQGLQGDDIERPGFQRIMDLAERNAIDVVIVWKLDRLARSLAHAAALEEYLRNLGVAIVSCTEAVDSSTPVGRFLFASLATAAQLEKDMIRERTQMGMFSRARVGKWTRPFVPLGYTRTKAKFLRVNEAEALVVRRVFSAYTEAGSYAMTAQKLSDEGLTNREKNWTAERVRQLLENRLYHGLVAASGVEVDMPKLAIITKEEFERCARLRQKSVRNGKSLSARARDAAIDSVFDQYFASLADQPEEQT